jgi:surface polysaccharide O-acyltransferase-like enzyme
LRFGQWRQPAFESLSANAYRIYLIHYVFAVWLQFALLGIGLSAIGKATTVFGLTVILSWAVAAATGRALPAMRLNTTLGGVPRA